MNTDEILTSKAKIILEQAPLKHFVKKFDVFLY
jgi:hypothetical protein